ncbi:porin family protein [Sphingomonas sp. MG17]|uniref:Porin family protein n=1 Tax=Sphingomonas tagetis TaxID=2949092 RepID=A0A9X2HFH7_9SPHN|nr:outer membrane beta-barrel protein [Sphingomonas tagetis]MCP3728852.1 porin family protein [Sphingomonas tagetis]
MRMFLATGLAALTIAAAPAFAQDGAGEFDGPYVGASVGYGFQSDDSGEGVLFDRGFNGSLDTITTAAGANAFSPGFCGGAATSSANTACTKDKDGVEYHFRAGWDAQSGNWVIGVVGEIGKSDVRDSVSAFSTTPASYTFTREIEWDASLRARAGYVAGDRTLIYATFGPSYARIENGFSTSNTANAFANNGKSDSWGVSGGGGVEHKIGRNFSVGLEYLYTRFSDDDFRVRVTQGTAPATNPFILNGAAGTEMRRSDPRFDWHAVRVTAAFRF